MKILYQFMGLILQGRRYSIRDYSAACALILSIVFFAIGSKDIHPRNTTSSTTTAIGNLSHQQQSHYNDIVIEKGTHNYDNPSGNSVIGIDGMELFGVRGCSEHNLLLRRSQCNHHRN